MLKINLTGMTSHAPSPLIEPKVNWTLEQLAIFSHLTHANERHFQITAGAGCGKSSTIREFARRFYMRNSNARILVLAFNKSVAADGAATMPFAEVRTFHSFIMQNSPGRLFNGILFAVKKQLESELAVRMSYNVITLVEFAMKLALHPEASNEKFISLARHFSLSVTERDISHAKMILERVLEERNYSFDSVCYRYALANHYEFDIDFPSYDLILIDEAQDLSAARLKSVQNLVNASTRPTLVGVVGDPLQSIYGFTGSLPTAMNDCAEAFNVEHYPLQTCFRCDPVVIEHVKRVVPENSLTSVFTERRGSVRKLYVNDWIERLKVGLEQSTSVAVLSRTNAPLVELLFNLAKLNIRVRFEGRDIGEQMLKLVNEHNDVSSAVADITKQRNMSKADARTDILNCALEFLSRTGSIAEYQRTVDRLFSDTAGARQTDCVTFSSVHKSKGLEWDTVVTLRRESTMPSKYAKLPWELEQEKCLLNVMLTRAKRHIIELS